MQCFAPAGVVEGYSSAWIGSDVALVCGTAQPQKKGTSNTKTNAGKDKARSVTIPGRLSERKWSVSTENLDYGIHSLWFGFHTQFSDCWTQFPAAAHKLDAVLDQCK
jgi:hypothetical protein